MDFLKVNSCLRSIASFDVGYLCLVKLPVTNFIKTVTNNYSEPNQIEAFIKCQIRLVDNLIQGGRRRFRKIRNIASYDIYQVFRNISIL